MRLGWSAAMENHGLLSHFSFGVFFMYQIRDPDVKLVKWDRKDLHPVLYASPNVNIWINGMKSEREGCDIAAALFTGDVISASKKGLGLLEFSCEFFQVQGADRKSEPVEFVEPKGSIISI